MQHSTPVSYTDWNRAIVEHFYNPSQMGQPVYLQVDSDVIESIGQRLGFAPGLAEENFLRVVRQYVFATTPIGIRIGQSARYLRKNETVPEFVAFLALCVLASSKMERDEELGISSANYYHLYTLD